MANAIIIYQDVMNRRWPFNTLVGGGAGDGRGNNGISTSINNHGLTNSNSSGTTSVSRTRSNLLGPSNGINVNGISSSTTHSHNSSPSSSSFSSSHDVMGQISEICDGLYLCGARAIKIAKLRELGITAIFNVTIELPNLQLEKMEYIKITIEDSPYANLACYFDKVADKIEEVRQRGGKVLVHCVAGVSRSASLCIAYLLKHKRMNLRRAYHHVKTRRSIIRPNPGFFRQLVDYEMKLFGTPSVKMVWNAAAGGTIPDLYEPEYNNTLNFLNKYGVQNDRQPLTTIHKITTANGKSNNSGNNSIIGSSSNNKSHATTHSLGNRSGFLFY